MDVSDIIQTGLLAIGILTLIFYILQYRRNNQKASLDDEMATLSQAFRVDELYHPKYVHTAISYPNRISSETFMIDDSLSVFDSFYEYVRSAARLIPDSELTHREMIVLYNNFAENLVHRDRLDMTFQILYSCVHGIISTIGFNSYKKKRLSRVQNTITSKQLICYYFNQIQYFDRQRIYNKYIREELFEYEFFKKMFESEPYRQIQNQIPLSVEQLFYKQEIK